MTADWAPVPSLTVTATQCGPDEANVSVSEFAAELTIVPSVVIAENEQVSLMVNEEDHLRVQVIQSGLNLQNAWESINRVDDLVEKQVTYAFNEQLGYLTACPTNVGTGMRVSVMLHLQKSQIL